MPYLMSAGKCENLLLTLAADPRDRQGAHSLPSAHCPRAPASALNVVLRDLPVLTKLIMVPRPSGLFSTDPHKIDFHTPPYP